MRNWLAVIGWYALVSVVTFLVFGVDKWLGRGGSRRVPENALHFLEAIGGWPGALVASRIFSHKSRKRSYRVVLWLIVLLHGVVWAAYVLWWRAEREG